MGVWVYKVRVINFFLDVQVDVYYRSVLHVDMRFSWNDKVYHVNVDTAAEPKKGMNWEHQSFSVYFGYVNISMYNYI